MKKELLKRLQQGCVIPAHPLALTNNLHIDIKRQGALTRYYLDAGAGGLAVGVHTTQFAIHEPQIGLYQPVLELAADTSRSHTVAGGHEPILIAGIVGPTEQAVREAEIARELGYHLGLLSLNTSIGKSNRKLIDCAREVATILPIMGFYMPLEISGITHDRNFWKDLLQIPKLLGLKIAPFDRYRTMDVLEAVAESGRASEIALYTGNDDAIVQDLITPYCFEISGHRVCLNIVGGLLGQWACWTNRAVELLKWIQTIREQKAAVPLDLLTLGAQLTLANRAIFDSQNNFRGCIPGISYVLKRQGLLQNTKSLNSEDRLSPGQTEAINRILREYPHLTDNTFVEQNLAHWIAD
jgi:dihydrodipicolinate synthase/N-acetylneuraminate lyase